MTLRRHEHHQVGVRLAHRFGGGGGIGEIHPQQDVALGRLGQGLEADEITGGAALVEVVDQRLAACEQPAHHGPADGHAVGRRP